MTGILGYLYDAGDLPEPDSSDKHGSSSDKQKHSSAGNRPDSKAGHSHCGSGQHRSQQEGRRCDILLFSELLFLQHGPRLLLAASQAVLAPPLDYPDSPPSCQQPAFLDSAGEGDRSHGGGGSDRPSGSRAHKGGLGTSKAEIVDALAPMQDGGARVSHGASFHALDRMANLSSVEADASHGIASGARLSEGHRSYAPAPQMPVTWRADSRPQTEVLASGVLLSLLMHVPCTIRAQYLPQSRAVTMVVLDPQEAAPPWRTRWTALGQR